MAKRDGWRVIEDKAQAFSFSHTSGEWAECRSGDGEIHITCRCGWAVMPPARAIQFAEKVQEIAARAANKRAKGASDE